MSQRREKNKTQAPWLGGARSEIEEGQPLGRGRRDQSVQRRL